MRHSFIYLILLFGAELCPLQLLIKTTVVSTAVTMNTTATATIPPMMATVLSLSELLVVVVTLSSWEASEAAIKSNNYYSTLCSFELVPVEKVTVSGSSYITSSDSDSVDSGTLQLVYCVASASETATRALSSSVSLSPHHLPTGH